MTIVGGREVRIALALEPARERIAVVLVVVDDEQRCDGRIHAAVPFGARARIFSSRRGISTGLVSKSSQPAAMALSRSPVIALAVSAITGMCFVSSAALIWRVASEPSSTGKPKSIRI